jgi:hypothetical protein
MCIQYSVPPKRFNDRISERIRGRRELSLRTQRLARRTPAITLRPPVAEERVMIEPSDADRRKAYGIHQVLRPDLEQRVELLDITGCRRYRRR